MNAIWRRDIDTLELEDRLRDRSCIDADAHAAAAALKAHREVIEKAQDIVRYHVHPQRSGDPMHFDMQRLADLLLGNEADRIRAIRAAIGSAKEPT